MVKPFEHHRVSYQGKLCILKNPLEMADPAVAFKNNPYAPCELRLDYHGTAPGWGGEMREKSGEVDGKASTVGDATQQFAKGHLEQLGHAAGRLIIDGTVHLNSTAWDCAIIVGGRATGRRPSTIGGSR